MKTKEGKYKIAGDGVRVAIHRLFGDKAFSEDEVRNDILNKRLIVNGFEKDELQELLQLFLNDSWSSQVIDRDNLEDYLEFKNNESQQNLYQQLLEELRINRKTINEQSEMLRMLSGELVSLKNEYNQPSFVTVEEVAKLFPQYNINSLRNIIARNRYHDEVYKMWRSYIHIAEFNLSFRKPDGTKKWIADKVDFIKERPKTFDQKFKEKIYKRLLAGVRYFVI